MLQDLIIAAVNEAQTRAREEMEKEMSGLMGGMKMPGMF
jgi:DNA-binding protein YbaB